MNYYPFHIGDYIAHTAHLDPIEDCVYRRLLDAYYMTEGPLQGEVAQIARQIRMKANLAEVEQVLGEFFESTGAGWVHKRCETEIARMHEKSAKAKASAEASVNARKAKSKQKQSAGETNAQRTLSERLTNVELPNTQDPITNTQTPPHQVEETPGVIHQADDLSALPALDQLPKAPWPNGLRLALSLHGSLWQTLW